MAAGSRPSTSDSLLRRAEHKRQTQALTAKKRAKKDGPLRRIIGAIDAAGRDADIARRSASDPAFRRGVRSDRRGTLSKFTTVKHALADRERIEKAKKKT